MRDKILVTGAAGFIGFHVSKRLLAEYEVVGMDNLNGYYDQELKYSRLKILQRDEWFSFHKIDLADKEAFDAMFSRHRFRYVIHLAAQAGVRYSITNPYAYLNSNLNGFLNVIEACRHAKTEHLIFASSSSVYGANRKMPFSTHDIAVCCDKKIERIDGACLLRIV